MKLIKRRTEKSGPPSPVSRTFTPFWPMRRLQSEIDRLFADPFDRWLTLEGPVIEAWLPAVDVSEDENNVVVRAEIPGMKKEEFEVYMSSDNLNIAGERKVETEDKGSETYRAERYFGRFHRSILLPATVEADKIVARYKDGILTITCPKAEEIKRKQVEVKVD